MGSRRSDFVVTVLNQMIKDEEIHHVYDCKRDDVV